MKLWTVQALPVWEGLAAGKTHRTSWDHLRSIGPGWLAAYRWMVRRMRERGVDCDWPPIWAWHSGDGFRPDGPAAATIQDLLGGPPVPGWEHVLLELEHPDPTQVVLSRYDPWNRVLDRFLERGRVPERDWLRIYELDRQADEDEGEHLIQACFPELEPDWIRGARALRLLPADEWRDLLWSGEHSVWVLASALGLDRED